jgi:hypothetical protein
MKRLLTTAAFFLLVSTGFSGSSPANAQSEFVAWNQWRGPDRDGVAARLKLPRKLDDTTLQKLWSVNLGSSYSGPIVDHRY